MNSQQLAVLRQKAPGVKRVLLRNIRVAEWQRPLNNHRVRKIVREFDIYQVRRPLLVPVPDEKNYHYVVDGQHTVAALRTVGFNDWDCDVIASMSEVEMIERFAKQRTNVRAVNNLDRTHAEYVGYSVPGGHEIPEFQQANDIISAMKEAGWDYQRGRTGHPNVSGGMAVLTSTGIQEVYLLAEKEVKGAGRQAVTQVLTDIAEIWPNDPYATEPGFIRAMGKIERSYGALTDEQKTRLSAVPASTIRLAATGAAAQPDKRDKIANHIKELLGLRAKGEFWNTKKRTPKQANTSTKAVKATQAKDLDLSGV